MRGRNSMHTQYGVQTESGYPGEHFYRSTGTIKVVQEYSGARVLRTPYEVLHRARNRIQNIISSAHHFICIHGKHVEKQIYNLQ
jgi:hypothetical protein